MITSLVGVHPQPKKSGLVPPGSNIPSIMWVSYVVNYASYCNIDLHFPLSIFLLAVLQVLGVCYSQIPPSNMGRIMYFEILYELLEIESTVPLFAFFNVL